MRLAILTDAWYPQVNGVVRTLAKTINILESWNHMILCINPQQFRTIPLPSYPDIRIGLFVGRKIKRILDEYQPDAIHISTEGPIGWAGRKYCLHNSLPFTTAYHTRFPEYIRMRIPVPLALTYLYYRRFHNKATHTLVATKSMRQTLIEKGFSHLVHWSRGVDTDLFKPQNERTLDLPRPIHIYVGRVAVEKNIRDFLELDLPGSKVVIGDGPARNQLEDEYKKAHFIGYHENGDLVKHLASGDVMVFPSRTDTFGLVMLESMACGVPVAAYPVEGPLDVIENGINGFMDKDLGKAVKEALKVDSTLCRKYALEHTWEQCTKRFLSYIQIINRHKVDVEFENST